MAGLNVFQVPQPLFYRRPEQVPLQGGRRLKQLCLVQNNRVSPFPGDFTPQAGGLFVQKGIVFHGDAGGPEQSFGYPGIIVLKQRPELPADFISQGRERQVGSVESGLEPVLAAVLGRLLPAYREQRPDYGEPAGR